MMQSKKKKLLGVRAHTVTDRRKKDNIPFKPAGAARRMFYVESYVLVHKSRRISNEEETTRSCPSTCTA